MVWPDAMYQRPIPSVRNHFRSAPNTTAQTRTIPKSVPATRDETMSPAPTPVTAMTMPGPTYFSRLPKVLGASVSAWRPPATSAIGPLPRTRPQGSLDTLDTNHVAKTMVRPRGCRASAADPGLLEVEVALDAAHDLGADVAPIAQREDGLPLGPNQVAPPVPPGRGALRVLFGGAARLDAGLVAPDASFVVVAHLLLGTLWDPLVVAEPLQPLEGGAGSLEAGPELHERALVPFVLQAQRPDERPQRQPLHDECGEDHREGDEEDQVPHIEALPSDGHGHGEGRRQRDRAAHPAPAHHQSLLPWSAKVPVAQEPVEDWVEIGRGEEPGEARAQNHAVGEERVEQDLGQGVLPEVSEDGGELLTDQDKEQRLQDEDQDAPESERLDARGGVREQSRGPPPLVETVGDDGQDARDVQDLLGEDVHAVGNQDGEGDHDRGLPQAAPQRQDHPRESEAGHDPTPADQNEVQAGLPDRERAAAQGGQSHAEGHEPRAVVYEALAANDRAHALRHPQAAEDSFGGHRVGRREDRSEDEGRCPRQAGDKVGDGGDRERGE